MTTLREAALNLLFEIDSAPKEHKNMATVVAASELRTALSAPEPTGAMTDAELLAFFDHKEIPPTRNEYYLSIASAIEAEAMRRAGGAQSINAEILNCLELMVADFEGTEYIEEETHEMISEAKSVILKAKALLAAPAQKEVKP